MPPGAWAAEEYDLLPADDGDTGAQAIAGAFSVLGCRISEGSRSGRMITRSATLEVEQPARPGQPIPESQLRG